MVFDSLGKMVNGKYIFNVHWPNSLGLIEGFCTVCEQPWVDLNPRPFAQKATTLTSAPRRPHLKSLAMDDPFSMTLEIYEGVSFTWWLHDVLAVKKVSTLGANARARYRASKYYTLYMFKIIHVRIHVMRIYAHNPCQYLSERDGMKRK